MSQQSPYRVPPPHDMYRHPVPPQYPVCTLRPRREMTRLSLATVPAAVAAGAEAADCHRLPVLQEEEDSLLRLRVLSGRQVPELHPLLAAMCLHARLGPAGLRARPCRPRAGGRPAHAALRRLRPASACDAATARSIRPAQRAAAIPSRRSRTARVFIPTTASCTYHHHPSNRNEWHCSHFSQAPPR